MTDRKEWYFRTEEGRVYGPASVGMLAEWARDGRIEPSGSLSKDRINWTPAQLMRELEMVWLVESQPGKVYGPFNRAVVIRLSKSGNLPPDAKIYRLYELPVDKDPDPLVVEKEVRVEVPVEKIVEKEVRVEVPVEKIIERIVEKEVRVEVPVEKIVEKIVEVPVEKPPRTSFVVPEVVDAIDEPPPQRNPGGLFKNADRARLAALEQAARRELAAAGGLKFALFGRKRT